MPECKAIIWDARHDVAGGCSVDYMCDGAADAVACIEEITLPE